MDCLTELQRSRIEKYYFLGMTCREIRDSEGKGATSRAILYSIQASLNKMKKILSIVAVVVALSSYAAEKSDSGKDEMLKIGGEGKVSIVNACNASASPLQVRSWLYFALRPTLQT